jgi:hypothetical protein
MMARTAQLSIQIQFLIFRSWPNNTTYSDSSESGLQMRFGFIGCRLPCGATNPPLQKQNCCILQHTRANLVIKKFYYSTVLRMYTVEPDGLKELFISGQNPSSHHREDNGTGQTHELPFFLSIVAP